MGKEFLFEIGTEELPSAFVNFGMEKMESVFKNFFKENNLNFSNIKTFGTPRRIGLVVENLSEKQEDITIERTGPAKRVAIDENGEFTKAAKGFAKSQNVNVENLFFVTTDKGEYVAIQKSIKGKKSEDLLKENLPLIIKKIIFPKNMRWGNEEVSFVRPIHWIVSIFGDKAIEFDYGSVKSNNISFGHRFMSNSSFIVKNCTQYITELKNRFVIADVNERKAVMMDKIDEIANKLGGIIDKEQ
jgi:glycyl-tRNA synthetase beta chain